MNLTHNIDKPTGANVGCTPLCMQNVGRFLILKKTVSIRNGPVSDGAARSRPTERAPVNVHASCMYVSGQRRQ